MIARDNQVDFPGDRDRLGHLERDEAKRGIGSNAPFGPAQIVALAESLSRPSTERPVPPREAGGTTVTRTSGDDECRALTAATEGQEQGAAGELPAGASVAASAAVHHPDSVAAAEVVLERPDVEAEEKAEATPAVGASPVSIDAPASGDDQGLASLAHSDDPDLTVADDDQDHQDAPEPRAFELETGFGEGAAPDPDEATPSPSGAAQNVWRYGRPVLEDSRGAVGGGRRGLFGNRNGSNGSGSALDRLRAYQKLLQARANGRTASSIEASPYRAPHPQSPLADPQESPSLQPRSLSAEHPDLIGEPGVAPEPEPERTPDAQAQPAEDTTAEHRAPEETGRIVAQEAGGEDGEQRAPPTRSALEGGPSLDGQPLAALDHEVTFEPAMAEDDLGDTAASGDARTEMKDPSSAQSPAALSPAALDPVAVVPEVPAAPEPAAIAGPDAASNKASGAPEAGADAAGPGSDDGDGPGVGRDDNAPQAGADDRTTAGLGDPAVHADAAEPASNEGGEPGRMDPDVREDPVNAARHVGADPADPGPVPGKPDFGRTMRAIGRLRSFQRALQRGRNERRRAGAQAAAAGAEPPATTGTDRVAGPRNVGEIDGRSAPGAAPIVQADLGIRADTRSIPAPTMDRPSRRLTAAPEEETTAADERGRASAGRPETAGAVTEPESATPVVSRPQPPRHPRVAPGAKTDGGAKLAPAPVVEAEPGIGDARKAALKQAPAPKAEPKTVAAATRSRSAGAASRAGDNDLGVVRTRGRRQWEPRGRRIEDHRDPTREDRREPHHREDRRESHRDQLAASYARGAALDDDMAPHRFAGGGGGVEAPWMNLDGVLRCVRRRRLFISTIVGVVTLAVVIGVLVMTPRYTATAKVKVADVRSAQTLDRPLDPTILFTDEEAIESEVQVITSALIARRVIDELGLLDDLVPDAAAAHAEREAGHRVTLDLPRETVDASSSDSSLRTPEPAGAGSSAERTRAVEALLDRITVAREGRSRVISVSVDHRDPIMAARIANAIADTYVATRIEARAEAATKATIWLQARLDDLRSSVTRSETAVERYRQKSGLLEGNGSTIISQQLSDLSARLAAARARRVALESRLERVEAAGKDGWANMPEAVAHPLISDLRAEEYGLNRRLAELGADFGPNYSRRRKLEAQLQRIRADIATEAQRLVVSLRREVEAARIEEATVAEALDALTSQVGDLNINQGELRALEREATANQAVLETFLQWLKKTAGVQQFQEADARVISYAEMPLHPSFPQRKLFVALAFVGSLAGAIASALIMESLDSSFRSPRQIERLTGYRGLPVIPAIRGGWFRRADPLDYVLRYPRSSYTEAIRSLHAALAVGGVRVRPKSILIASAYPNEGKTTLAACYARVLANQGFAITLVDADLRHGRTAERFGLGTAVGLADVLAGDADLEAAMQRDPETSLRIVVAGRCKQSPQELLHNGMFIACLERLKASNDFVIVDSPPVLAVSDASLIARGLDATVYVTRWGVTARDEARSGLRLLQEAGANIAGVVLNATDLGKYAEFAYGHPHIYKKAMAHYYGG